MLLLAGLLFISCAGCAAKRPMGGPLPAGGLRDGVYQGEATSGPVTALVEVRILDRRITGIRLIEHRHWRGGAAEAVIARIMKEQSTAVDAVSGATTSSIAIMNSVEDAVRKAR
jgi:uncharacterized protein with FMN-binding domain